MRWPAMRLKAAMRAMTGSDALTPTALIVAGAWERATAGDATVVTLAASPLIENGNG